MLGELIMEERGKRTGLRVLPSKGQGPVVEVSFQASGRILGVEEMDLVTYTSVARPGGFLFGQGQGIVMTKDGDRVTWTGHGSGKFTGQAGAVSYRGAVYYETASQKLARLNGAVGVFEYEADENGNTHSKVWEWK